VLRGARLQLNLAAGLPPIEADVAEIQQLVMNVVISAAEAIGDRPGTVVIRTYAGPLPADFSCVPAFAGLRAAPGRGTTFTIVLPAALRPVAPHAPSQARTTTVTHRRD
jgi:signal transduction histidine kinase